MTTQDPAPATDRRDTTRPAMGDHTMGIHPHQISVPPWAVLGYRADGRPIRPIAGGAESDDPAPEDTPEPESEPAEAPEEDPAEGDQPKPKPPAKDPKLSGEEEFKPPTRSEWERTQAALKKANDEAKRHRLRARELEDAARTNETDHERAVREAREEGEKRFREPMKRAGVRAALAEAGFASPDRLLKLVDWDALSVDDDGDVVGTEAEVERLRREYPEFLPQAAPRPKPKPTGAPKSPAPDKPKASWELHAARALGKA